MDLKLRRIGNSVGVIIPGDALRAWALSAGDSLELKDDAIRPPRERPNRQEQLDHLKRNIALEVVRRHPAEEIRRNALANLARWKDAGVWSAAYQEWFDILSRDDDGTLYAAMLGLNERSNRLRQSPPFVGMLSQPILERLREEALG